MHGLPISYRKPIFRKDAIVKVVIALICGVLAVSYCLAMGQENSPKQDGTAAEEIPKAKKEREFNFWMDTKLLESQTVFAALAKANFDAIIKSTDGLKVLTRIEGFVRRRSREYSTQLRSFEFAIDEMNRQAKAKNLEGVVLGFHQMTLSCVNCHKQLKDPNAESNEP